MLSNKNTLPLKFPVKLRYLPGEIENIRAEWDLRLYRLHRVNVEYAKCKVDNKAPKVCVGEFYDPKVLEDKQFRVFRIDTENMRLMKALNLIQRKGGKVDCWMKDDIRHKMDDLAHKAKHARENKRMYQMICKVPPNYQTAKYLKDWKRIKAILEDSKYPHYLLDPRFIPKERRNASISKGLDIPNSVKRSQHAICFFDLEMVNDKLFLGRIVFELYSDIVPLTCANFEAFCRGTNGLSFKKTPFHRIHPGYWCQGGDVTKFSGTGGTSVYGDNFPVENFSLMHSGPGVLSTCVDDDGLNDSKFNLTFRQLPTMDGKKVVFGKVISGMKNLYKIEAFGSKSGKAIKQVIVVNCGVLRPGKEPEGLES